jgi:hypothetical protein
VRLASRATVGGPHRGAYRSHQPIGLIRPSTTWQAPAPIIPLRPIMPSAHHSASITGIPTAAENTAIPLSQVRRDIFRCVDMSNLIKVLVHDRPAGSATARGDVPEIDELLSGELVLVDQEFAKAAIHPPPPALAAAWALHVGMRHGIVVGDLFRAVQMQVVVRHELLRHAGRDVIRIGPEILLSESNERRSRGTSIRVRYRDR